MRICGEPGSFSPAICSNTNVDSSRSSLMDNVIWGEFINELLVGFEIDNTGNSLSKTIF